MTVGISPDLRKEYLMFSACINHRDIQSISTAGALPIDITFIVYDNGSLNENIDYNNYNKLPFSYENFKLHLEDVNYNT